MVFKNYHLFRVTLRPVLYWNEAFSMPHTSPVYSYHDNVCQMLSRYVQMIQLV